MYFWSHGQSILLTLNYFNIMIWATPGTPAGRKYKTILKQASLTIATYNCQNIFKVPATWPSFRF
jgi:hypothetical protein